MSADRTEGPTRKQRSNYEGQEETVSALWEFARDVIALGDAQSFSDHAQYTTPVQLAAIRKAMERISAGYGYRLLEIQ